MALTTDQTDWLNLFTRGKALPGVPSSDPLADIKAILDEDELRLQARREAELARSIKAIETAKKELQDSLAMQFQVQGKDTATRDKLGRQEKEFDTEESSGISTKLQDEKTGEITEFGKKLIKANNAMKPLADESERLRVIKVDCHVLDEDDKLVEEEVALFTDEQIMRSFYSPLVRELVVPENFVPPRYSATQKMIDGSNDFYVEECKEKGKSPELGLADLGKGCVQVASIAVQAAFGSGTDGAMITEGVALAIGTGIDGTVLVVDAYENQKFDQDSWVTVATGVASAVGKIIGGATDDPYGGDSIAQFITIGIRSTSAVTRVARWVDKGGPFPGGALIGDILNGVTAVANQKSDVTSKDDSLKATIVAVSIDAFANTLKKAEGELTGLSKQPPKQWGKSLARVLLTACAESGKAYETERAARDLDFYKDPSTGQDATPTSEDINKRQKTAEKQNAAIDDTLESIDKLFETEDEDGDKHEKDEEDTSTVEKQIEEEKKAYLDTLDRLGTMDDETATPEDFKSIAKLIAKLEQDRKILDMAAKVATLPFNIAAEFFAPLKAAGALVKFMTNLHAAIERANAWLAWLDSNQDALISVSPYATSIQNFVKNQGDQFTHHTVQAALQGLQAASAIAENGYPPLKALTSALTGAALLEEAIYKFVKQQQLRAAWRTTEKALNNPANRKLGLIARKMNPTLAKYTIAYGAVVEKSPIAIAAMNRCGLDRETLSRANANVKLVKDYLQTLYNEDGVLLGPIPQGPNKKSLPKPALTVKSWAITVELWRTQERLDGDPPAELRVQLARLEKLEAVDRTRLVDDALTDHLDARIAALDALEQAYAAYAPVGSTGIEIKGSSTVLSAYADLAGSQAELSRQELNANG